MAIRIFLSDQIKNTFTSSSKRVSGSLQSLLKCGEIGSADVAAAERWYKDYMLGIIGAHDPETKTSGKKPDIHASMISRINAVSRCKLVQKSLGQCSEYRLRLLLVDDLSFSAIAIILKMNDANGRKRIAAQMTFLLQQLTELYYNMDNKTT